MESQEILVISGSDHDVPFVKKATTNLDEDWVQKLSQSLKWNRTVRQKPLKSKKNSRRAKL
jgi:hypothetical protein